MTILGNWITMREQWSALGTTDNDGIKTWDTSKLELGYDGGSLTGTRVSPGYVWDIESTDACDWFFSAPASQWWTTSEESSTTIRIVLSAEGFDEVSGLSDAERRRLWRDCWIYARRTSDGAIAAGNCELLADIATSESTTL